MMMNLSDDETRASNTRDILSDELERVRQHLAVLDPTPSESSTSARQALSRFEDQYMIKENSNMFNRIFNRKYRFAWVAVGVIAILGLAMLFPQVRAIGSSFLGLFRVEQVTILQVDPEQLEERLSSASNFEYLLAEDVQVEELGEQQEVASADEASRLAGIPVRLPSAVEGETYLEVQPGMSASMQVDLPKVQALLDEIGYSDLKLPADLDGAVVTMELPVAVAASFGDCGYSEEFIPAEGVDPDHPPAPRLLRCTTLLQVASPEISAPPGLDIAGIGEIFLQVLGMTPEEAAQFTSSVDWTTTLIIPIPRNGTEYQDVFVDGVDGTLILQTQRSDFPEYLLIWIKDGVVYALSGPGDADSALQIADSLE
jgi:hypothetical protein